MFENLITMAAGNPELIAELTKAKGIHDQNIETITKNDKKIVDLTNSRNKYKSFTKDVKKGLGIEDGEELTDELISTKITGIKEAGKADLTEKEKVLKQDILNLEDIIKTKETDFTTKLKEKEQEVFNVKFDVRAKDALINLDLVNEKAFKMVESEVKNGISFDTELNDFVYKNADGTVSRNPDGSVMSVEQKVEVVKSSDDFSFLFKAPSNSGSNTNTGGSGSGGESDPWSKIANRS